MDDCVDIATNKCKQEFRLKLVGKNESPLNIYDSTNNVKYK